MKHLLAILFFVYNISALELIINSGKEQGAPYSVLNIKNDTEFHCADFLEEGKIVLIRCYFDKTPPYKLTRTKNSFFDIDFAYEDGRFRVGITPKSDVLLFSLPYSIDRSMLIESKNPPFSKKWQVIAYSGGLPFLNLKKYDGINFPINIENHKYPSIGALDFKGVPIEVGESPDIDAYLEIKKMMERKEYEAVPSEVKDVLSKYPESLFRSDLGYFEIKAIYETGEKADRETLVDIAKAWIKENPTETAVPEVLTIIADTYAHMGFYEEAQYFFDRIFFEYADSPYDEIAKIKLGDSFIRRENGEKAYILYNQALFETKELDVAALAAFRLAQMLIDKNIEEAGENIEKIASANPKFLYEHLDDSMKLAEQFVDREAYKSAATIANTLSKFMQKPSVTYETMLYNNARWLDAAGEGKEAFDAYKKYLDEYPVGLFAEAAKQGLDKLFIESASKDNNAIEQIDKIIAGYQQGSSLHSEAMLKKAKILLSKEMYKEVIDMKSSLAGIEGAEAVIKEAALNIAQALAKEKDCKGLFSYIIDYSLELPSEYDRGVSECGMSLGFESQIKPIVERHLDDKNLNDRLFWLYNYLKILYGEGKDRLFIAGLKDLITLSRDLKKEADYADIYYLLLEAAKTSGDKNGMLDSLLQIERFFPNSYKTLEAYNGAVKFFLSKNDDTTALLYALKLQDSQEKIGSFPFSPWVSIVIMDLYNKSKEFKKSIDESKKVKNLKDNPQYYYLLGSALQGVGELNGAKDSYSKCAQSPEDSPYRALCKQLLEIIK